MSAAPLALLFIAGLFFWVATLLYYDHIRVRRNDTGFWASICAVIGWSALTVGGLIRSALLGRLPLGTFSDSLILFLWFLAAGYFVVEYRWRLKVGGAFVLPVVTVGVFYASSHPSAAGALLPVLRSPWVGLHVGLTFLSYCSFALAGLAGLLYLLQERELKSKRPTFMHFSLPSLTALEGLSSTLVWWGFPFLTLGIIVGSLWSRQVWGTYFPWDPKMIWAVVTWLFYSTYLCGRWAWGWRGRRVAILTLVGFVAVVFNYLGISFMMQSVHRF